MFLALLYRKSPTQGGNKKERGRFFFRKESTHLVEKEVDIENQLRNRTPSFVAAISSGNVNLLDSEAIPLAQPPEDDEKADLATSSTIQSTRYVCFDFL